MQGSKAVAVRINPIGNKQRKLLLTCYAGLIVLATFPAYAWSQNTVEHLAFYPIAEHTYGIKDGLPDVCINNILLDSKGRLHLAACGTNYAAAALQVSEFDGMQAYPSEFKLDHNPQVIIFEEGIAPDLLYGFYTYWTKNGQLRYAVFRYNGISRATHCFAMPEQAIVQNVVFAEGALFVCVYDATANQVEIIQIRDGALRSLRTFSLEAPAKNIKLGVAEQDFWLGQTAGSIHRINRKTGAHRTYTLPDSQNSERPVYQLITTPGNDLWINCGGIYCWDAATDRFIKNPYLPASWKHSTVTDCMISKPKFRM